MAKFGRDHDRVAPDHGPWGRGLAGMANGDLLAIQQLMGHADSETSRLRHSAPRKRRAPRSVFWSRSYSWMRHGWILFVGLILTIPASSFASEIEPTANPFAALSTLTLEGALQTPVHNFPFQREAATFVLEEGTLYLLPELDVSGTRRRCLAVFTGQGRILYAPPTVIERDQLSRYLKTEKVDAPFTQLFFAFGDYTGTQLQNFFTFSPVSTGKDAPSRDTAKFLETVTDYLLQGEGDDPPLGLTSFLLNREYNEYFYAHVDGASGDFCFEVDPGRPEEVAFARDIIGRFKHWEWINLFHRQSDYQLAKQDDYDSMERVRAFEYDLDVTLDRGLAMTARANVGLECRVDSLRWIPLFLLDDLEVKEAAWVSGVQRDAAAQADSRARAGETQDAATERDAQAGEAADAGGRDTPATPTRFWKSKDSSVLWIAADPPLLRGERRTLRVDYHGQAVERNGDWIALQSSKLWYPQTLQRELTDFDIRYHIPEEFDFVSAGDQVEERLTDRVRHTYWKTARPSRNMSFSLGFFKEHNVNDTRIPPVTVFMSEAHHREIGGELIEEGVVSGANMEREVAADVANALAFYQQIFGPCSSSHLDVTEIPSGHGEAFPGMIQLAWSTFQSTDEDGNDETFRAHEVAHQWWGHGVDFVSYHDQWLSEAFAEYASLWFLQAVEQDNERFFDLLREWRDDIYDNRQFVVGSGRDAGPIWLGYRTRAEGTAGDYDLIVYKKGAWVLHMLRNMLLDLDTMSDAKFTALLKDFYERYQFKRASTTDFQELVSQHIGMDMSWFFDQWVLRTALPRYEYAYHVTEEAPDSYKVRVRIAQLDVPETFRAYIPITVDFGEGRFSRLRAHVVGPVAEFDLPPLSLPPLEVRFNDMESVLCRGEKKPW